MVFYSVTMIWIDSVVYNNTKLNIWKKVIIDFTPGNTEFTCFTSLHYRGNIWNYIKA